MSVILLRPYSGFATGAEVTLPDSTESALIAQGLATASDVTSFTSLVTGVSIISQGGNFALARQAGESSPVSFQGPLNWPCFSLGSAALTGYETNGVAQVAGTMNLTEIYVPFWNRWTGAGILNGTTVGTHNVLTALYGSNGSLLANSAVAGVVSASASVFQNISYTDPIILAPGRYFLGFQYSGVTPTPRHILAANGSNICTGTQAGVFGTVPTSLTTIPITFTTAVGPICQLFT